MPFFISAEISPSGKSGIWIRWSWRPLQGLMVYVLCFKQSNIFLQCCLFLLLGSTFNIPSGSSHGFCVVSQGLCYCTEHSEKYKRTERDHFLLPYELTGETNSSLKLTTVATGGGYAINTVLQYVLQLIVCNYNLILPFNACLHFLDCKWHKVQFVSVWKSDKF